MNCICTYQWRSQAEQFAKEFSEKFGVKVEIKKENGCYSSYTPAKITDVMLHFTHHEFLLLPENRSIPDAPHWREREAA